LLRNPSHPAARRRWLLPGGGRRAPRSAPGRRLAVAVPDARRFRL